MDEDRLQRLEDSLARLTRRVEALEATLHEGVPAHRQASSAEVTDAAAHAAPVPEPVEVQKASFLPLLGRTLLVLGGAFFLRAATDSGALPETTGAAVGLVYGMLFLLLAFRSAAPGGSYRGAQFHGLSAALIIFPLLLEATVHFHYLPAPVSAFALALAVGTGLWISWRRSLRAVAWLFAASGASIALALALTTHLWIPFLAIALAVFWTALFLSYARRWTFLGISGALLADMTVLLVTSLYLLEGTQHLVEGLTVSTLIALQVGLVAAYLGTFSVRILVRGRDIQWMEAAQTAAVLMVGMGGALLLAPAHPHLDIALGVLSLAGAGINYGISFVFIDRRRGRGRNYMFYTSIALVLMLVTVFTLLHGFARTWGLLVLTVLTVTVASRKQRATLLLHATVFTVTAAISSGLLGVAAAGLFGRTETLESRLLLPFAAILLVTTLCTWLRVAPHPQSSLTLLSAPRILCLSLLVFSCCGLAVMIAAATLATSASAVDAGVAAAVRTGLLALFAVASAWLSRHPRFPEARWLVYPILVLGGLALLLGDFRHGRPATMFVSLVLYGGALILAPRLLKAGRRESRPETAA